jgi:hypothetical protein
MIYLSVSRETDEAVTPVEIASNELSDYELNHPDIYLIPFEDLSLPEEDLWELF